MPPAEQFDGVSLLPWLMGYTPPPTIHYQLFWHGVLGDTAVQSHGWKLRRSRETFLFDIENDPCKQRSHTLRPMLRRSELCVRLADLAVELYNLAESHASGGPKMEQKLGKKHQRKKVVASLLFPNSYCYRKLS